MNNGTRMVVAVVLVLCVVGLWNRVSAAEKAVVLPSPSVDAPLAATSATQTAVLAGGCFWGVQAVLGYSGGSSSTAEYETVSTGRTGHAESVAIMFDPAQITYGQLLKVFFSVAHNPTQLNRQGPDFGTQYRSVIFY